MGDIASLDQTLLSPRPLLHQLNLVGPCRPGSNQLKTSPFVYNCYDSNPVHTEPCHSPLPSAGANHSTTLTSLPLTLPLGGARWTRNNNVPVSRSDSGGTEKRHKANNNNNNTVAQKRKVINNRRVTAVDSSVSTSSISTQRTDRTSFPDGGAPTVPDPPKQQSFPPAALQVPSVDSRSEAQSRSGSTVAAGPFPSPHSAAVFGMPSVKAKPGARPRKMDRRMVRQKRTNSSTNTPVLQKTCAYLEVARTVAADDCTSKDMDEVARMALRSSNYDWSQRRVPDGQRGNPSEDGYYGVVRCAGGPQRSLQDAGTTAAAAAYGGCHQNLDAVMGVTSQQQLQHQQGGGYITAQENCHGYLYSAAAAAALSPDLLMQGSTLMGETGPAAEKLKQIAAQHQMKESSRYAEIEGYDDEYSGYLYRQQSTDLYPVGAQYPLSGTPYPEPPAYLLSVQYPGRIESDLMDTDISSESTFGATKPLSHYPSKQLALTNDLDSTNHERLLYHDQKRPASLTNRQAINYVEQMQMSGEANQRNNIESFQTMSANRVPPPYHATDDVRNTNAAAHRAMMEQYGRHLQNARMFASEYSKQGDTSTHPVPTPMEAAPSSRSQCGTAEDPARRSVQPQPNSPFISMPSSVVSYSAGMEVGLPTSTVDRGRTLTGSRWTLPGHHPFVGGMSVLADINGNGEFPDLTGHSPGGIDCTLSPMLIGKRKLHPNSGLVSPVSGYHYPQDTSAQPTLPSFSTESESVVQANERSQYCSKEMRVNFSENNSAWSSMSQVAPQGTSSFDVNPAQWGKYYHQPHQNNNAAFSGSPYALGNSLYPEGPTTREESGNGAVPTGDVVSPSMDFANRWTMASSESPDAPGVKDPHQAQTNKAGHLASCKYSSTSSSSSSSNSSSSSSASSSASSTTPAAAATVAATVPGPADFVGSACEDDVELFSYVDDGGGDDSPVELNFIDDLLSATR